MPGRPTREDVAAAAGKVVPDVIAPDLKVLFCGINPGLYTAAVGHHFARPGNRFWRTLHAAGFTDRLLSPHEEHEMLCYGYGITNIVPRATATAAELTQNELVEGGRLLLDNVQAYRPKILAILGIGAYRTAFANPKAHLGPQDECVGDTMLWVLPNPSGLNANYRPDDLTRIYRELRLTFG